jgi:tetratricopeptide (TPR) repeat protein
MVRRASWSYALCWACAVAMASPTVWADPPPDPKSNPSRADIKRARELFDNGATLFAEGTYDGAIEAFRRAFQLSGEANCLFNIALAYDRLERLDDAIEYLQYYRAYAPKREHESIAQRIDALQTRKRKAEDEAAQKAAEAAAIEAARAAAAAEEQARLEQQADADAPKVFGPVAIAGTAVAVAGFGIAAGLGIASLRRKDDAASACGLGPDGDRFCPAQVADDLRMHRRFAIGADVCIGIGVAGAITAIAVVAAAVAKRRRDERAVAWTPGQLSVRF